MFGTPSSAAKPRSVPVNVTQQLHPTIENTKDISEGFQLGAPESPCRPPTQQTVPGPVIDNVLSPVVGHVAPTSLDRSVQPVTPIRPLAYSFRPLRSRSATADATTTPLVHPSGRFTTTTRCMYGSSQQ